MLFSYNWLQSFFKKKLPDPEGLAELLTMHAFEVEEVRKEGKDYILDVDILPNRGSDCFSYLGLAREISALLGTDLVLEESKIEEGKEKTKDLIKIKVNTSKDCFRYTVRVVKGVRVRPSPRWLQERLKTVGLKPVNNVVDIANFVMLEMGQPLHAFDLDRVKGRELKVRKAKKGEKIVTLDDETYQLDRDILVIADSESPLAIAGIKGGKRAEITLKTKNIVLESANFNPKAVRKASKKIDLRTDASWRFEHGIDPILSESAVNRASFLIQEEGRGSVCQGLVDFYPQKAPKRTVKLKLDYVRSLLGVDISSAEIKNILKRLYFKITKSSKEEITVLVPSFRLDVELPEDLIEEVGRMYGYESIVPKFPVASLIPPLKNLNNFWEGMVKTSLKEAGFTEVYSNSFINKDKAKVFGFKHKEIIETENPISAEYQYLRPSLLPNLLTILGANQRAFDNIKIFELGKIFQKGKVREKRALTGASNSQDFYEVKGIVDFFLNRLGIADVWYDQYQPTPENTKALIWNRKKCAEIKIGNNNEVGFIGEISSGIKQVLKLQSPTVVFDIDFERLQKLASDSQEFYPISPYPAAIRDIAVLVPKKVSVEEILSIIDSLGSSLVRDVDLFDIYEGDEIPEEKKNLAFHIIYQAEDRTMSSEEIDKIQEKIVKALDKEFDWEVRK